MKKGVVGGGQKVGVLSFPFFFFSFLFDSFSAFLLAFIFFDFCRCIFFALDGQKKMKMRRRRKSLDAIFSYLFDTQKPTKKKIEKRGVVLNRPLVLGLSPLSLFFLHALCLREESLHI